MDAVRSLDTSPDARRIQQAVWRRMSPSERVDLAVAMSEDVREIASAGIRLRHPDWSDDRVRRALLERLYGTELVARAWGPAPEQ